VGGGRGEGGRGQVGEEAAEEPLAGEVPAAAVSSVAASKCQPGWGREDVGVGATGDWRVEVIALGGVLILLDEEKVEVLESVADSLELQSRSEWGRIWLAAGS